MVDCSYHRRRAGEVEGFALLDLKATEEAKRSLHRVTARLACELNVGIAIGVGKLCEQGVVRDGAGKELRVLLHLSQWPKGNLATISNSQARSEQRRLHVRQDRPRKADDRLVRGYEVANDKRSVASKGFWRQFIEQANSSPAHALIRVLEALCDGRAVLHDCLWRRAERIHSSPAHALIRVLEAVHDGWGATVEFARLRSCGCSCGL